MGQEQIGTLRSMVLRTQLLPRLIFTGQGKGAKGEVRTSAEVSPFYLNRFSAPLLPNTLLLDGV